MSSESSYVVTWWTYPRFYMLVVYVNINLATHLWRRSSINLAYRCVGGMCTFALYMFSMRWSWQEEFIAFEYSFPYNIQICFVNQTVTWCCRLSYKRSHCFSLSLIWQQSKGSKCWSTLCQTHLKSDVGHSNFFFSLHISEKVK